MPAAWLRSYCDPGTGAQEMADALTMAGVKLERLDHVGVGDPGGFVIGKVLESGPHPDADRLSVCLVDDGSGEPRTIVCGAPNVAAGQTVAVALPGAVMPDGSKLGEAKLRGVRSSGMILAEDEVGLGTDHAGIMVLDDSLAAGAPLDGHLPISDDVLELEVTPNRPDVMGVYGVARDLHAVTGAPLAEDPTARDAEPAGSDDVTDHATLEIDPEVCLRFTARVFEDVTVGPSPLWLKQRLMAAGQRPISNVVDITNYVMLTTGQPLHAFDLDRVRGGRIVVRRAHDGEKMTTLDDAERTLSSDMAVVADAEGPSGHRRRDGRPDLRGLGRHHARADGGGHLGRPQHHAHLQGARPAQRGLGPLREAAASGPGDRGAAPGRPADGGAHRGPARARHAGRVPGARREPRGTAAPRPDGAPAGRADRAGHRRGDPHPARLRAARRRAGRCRPGAPAT